ncbi:hypothetical protein IAT38_007760 [Cryptococcus sp. DSM 104549]
MSCGNVPEGATDNDGEKVSMQRRRQVRRVDKSICQKCQLQKSMYIIRNVTFCKTCFEAALFARFSKTLHPTLKLPSTTSAPTRASASHAYRPPLQPGSALIALSSGCGSTALLDLLLTRGYIGRGDGAVADKTKGEKDCVWGKGWAVYVEFGGVVEGLEEREGEVRELVEGYGKGLGWVGLRAEDVFDKGLRGRLRRMAGVDGGGSEGEETAAISVDLKDPDLPLFPLPTSASGTSTPPTPLTQLRTLLASLPPPSRPSLLAHILSSLLTLTAETLPNISHVLQGETSTRQAQRLIAGTALGRGWALPLELASSRPASGSGPSSQKVTWLKPMKELTVKEAAIYCHLKGLGGWTRNGRRWEASGPVGKRDARGKGGVTSLEQLTEQFIAGLSVTHPSTVSTINRTGDKLVFPGDYDTPPCPVCQMPVDPSALDWKSRTALTSLPTKTPPPPPRPAEHTTSLAPLLCYSCLTTFTPQTVVVRTEETVAEPVGMPLWVGEGVGRRLGGVGRPVGRKEMRGEIAEFLIDDE